MSNKVMSVPEIIRKKRDKQELSDEEIEFFIGKIISPKPGDRIHDSQIGAFLMAAYLNGLCTAETAALVKAMTNTGFTFVWPESWKGTVVDKHSTGGVGDKVSLVLAPILAACGLRVPMISGRGLDFTGGTLDKLESIPGFSVSLSKERMVAVLETVGCCIVGQTADIAPADKLIYSIRDTTATVDNEDLIVASIISKKAAEGLDSLVLDVKTGKGAMMKDIKNAESLAKKLVMAGNMFDMKVSALITNMDAPLGKAIGNSLEVAESIECLQGKGPEDLLELTATLGGKLLQSIGKANSIDSGIQLIKEQISSGKALLKFKEMVIAQGSIPDVAQEICYGNMWKYLPRSKKIIKITSPSSGYVSEVDAMKVARICHGLGCGRSSPGEAVKFEPGVILLKKPGDAVSVGENIAEVHLSDEDADIWNDVDKVTSIFVIVDHYDKKPLILNSFE